MFASGAATIDDGKSRAGGIIIVCSSDVALNLLRRESHVCSYGTLIDERHAPPGRDA